jgi:predicted XRE-type DNA-binding protein
MRSDLTSQIINNFKQKNLTVTSIANESETSRARVTRILKRDTQGISLDVLFRVLGATGQGVLLKFFKVS